MWSLYCDLSATLWKWSSELLILRTNIADKHSTIMGTRIVHPSLTHFKLLCSFYRYQYKLIVIQYTSLAIQYSTAKSFNNLNTHLSLVELRHQIRLELHPSDFSCVLEIQYDQLVFHLSVSNIIRMIHNLLKFLQN